MPESSMRWDMEWCTRILAGEEEKRGKGQWGTGKRAKGKRGIG